MLGFSAPTRAAVNGAIVFTGDRTGHHQLYVVNADGTGERQLTNDPYQDDNGTWSPDQTQIAFMSTRGSPTGQRWGIFVMNADGTNVRQLTTGSSARFPAWSPDGTKIAYMQFVATLGQTNIFTMSADGSNKTQLTFDTAEECCPDWSPTGTQIVYESKNTGKYHIKVMSSNGANQVDLTPNDLTYSGTPSWSPDGTKIAFRTTRSNNNEIFTMSPDGSNLVNVTRSVPSEFRPDWSPDGSAIVYQRSIPPSGTTQLFKMASNGSLQLQVTNDPGNQTNPDWGGGAT